MKSNDQKNYQNKLGERKTPSLVLEMALDREKALFGINTFLLNVS